MAKNDFPTPTPAEPFPLGHAKENKDASAYTGFKYPSGGGDDIGIYKQPMNLPNEDIHFSQDPNKLKAQQIGRTTGTPRVSAGDPGSKDINKHGEKTMRGYGAAIKGIKTRGPMA